MAQKLIDSMSLEELRVSVSNFRRLLLPVQMQLIQAHLAGEAYRDEEILFSFMGSGASDYTTVGDFRRAMGDERQ